jgi:hypothetical protein
MRWAALRPAIRLRPERLGGLSARTLASPLDLAGGGCPHAKVSIAKAVAGRSNLGLGVRGMFTRHKGSSGWAATIRREAWHGDTGSNQGDPGAG